MRRVLTLVFLVAAALSAPLSAQDKPKLPPDLQPVPEPPPPPAGYELNPALEPQVTITTRGDEKVEEFRIGGKMYMMRITPKIGAPYFLVDHKGDGNFTRMDNLDSGLRVPQWVLFKF